MKTPRDVSAESKSDEARVREITRTVQLATQVFDGHLLSDRELDELCNAVLIFDKDDRQTKSKSKT